MLADDLVQDVLVKALLNEDKFKKGTNLEAWLTIIMKNCFIDSLNAKKQIASSPNYNFDEMYSFCKTEKVSKNLGASNIGVDAINTLINNLDTLDEQLIRLWLLGYKYKELAIRFDFPIGTIKYKLHHAKKTLINQLIQLGYE